MIKSKSTGYSNIKVPSSCNFWDDFLSSHMCKPYDIPREELLTDRTSLVHVYLLFDYYRTKGLNTICFICVCVRACVSVNVLLAVL